MDTAMPPPPPPPHVYTDLLAAKRHIFEAGAEMVVTYLALPPNGAAAAAAEFDINIVDSVPVKLKFATIDRERIGVVVALEGQSKKPDRERCYYYFGVVSVVDLMTTATKASGWPPRGPSMVDSTKSPAPDPAVMTVTVRRSDCVLTRSPLPVTLAAVYDPPPPGTPLSSLMPTAGTFTLSIDDAKRILADRLAQYKKPTWLLLTERDRQMDRLSYTLALCSIAQYMPRGTNEGLSGTVRMWIKGEMRLARFRMRVAHVPALLASRGWKTLNIKGDGVDPDCDACQVNDGDAAPGKRCTDPIHRWGFNAFNKCGGVSFMDVPDLMGIALTPIAALVSGNLITRHALYVRHAMLMQEQTHVLNLDSAPFIEDRDEMLLQFYVKVQNNRKDLAVLTSGVAETMRPSKVGAQRAKGGGTRRMIEIENPTGEGPVPTIQPIRDLDDMQRVMPGCMRDMAEKAFRRGNKDNLRHEDRTIFFHYLLVQNFDKDMIFRALERKFKGTTYEARGGLVKQFDAVHAAQKDVDNDKYGYFHSCKFLMANNKCPYFTGDASKARVACHNNQLAMAMVKEDPDGRNWSIGWPTRYSQKMKRLLALNAPPPPPKTNAITAHFPAAAAAASSSAPMSF